MTVMENLQEELAYFGEIKASLLKTNAGQFVLIKGRENAGAFTTAEQAYEAGIKKYGAVSFLVKQILEKEIVHKIPALSTGITGANI